MVPLRIKTILGAALLINFGLAKPRTPLSSRFPPPSGNSVGEFVLWSCTASAQLQRNNARHIIHIAPVSDVDKMTVKPPSQEDDQRINNIKIIKINTIPQDNGGKSDSPSEKPAQDSSGINDHGTQPSNDIPIFDTPLRTIKVSSYREDIPVRFKPITRLPQLEDTPIKHDEIAQEPSKIIVIRPE